MELSSEQLVLLDRMGKSFFDIPTCAKALGIEELDLVEMMQDPNNEAFKAYNKGFLTAELKLRESVIATAERGSSPAQVMVQKYIDSAKLNN